MPRETIIETRDGEPLDLIAWRHRGATAGLVEQALEINPGLASRGAVLPRGLAVRLPEPSTAAPVRETVKLWG